MFCGLPTPQVSAAVRYTTESIDRTQTVALKTLNEQDRRELDALPSDSPAADRWFRYRGLEYIRDYPWQTVGNGFRKIVNAFGCLPSPRRSFWPDLVQAFSYGPIMILGLWGMWVSRCIGANIQSFMRSFSRSPWSRACFLATRRIEHTWMFI
jgi:hypothetical protein